MKLSLLLVLVELDLGDLVLSLDEELEDLEQFFEDLRGLLCSESGSGGVVLLAIVCRRQHKATCSGSPRAVL